MASERFAQLLDRLGLRDQKSPITEAVEALELGEEEWTRLADAMNVELGRIYAERNLADKMRVVPHEEIVDDQLVDTFDSKHPALVREPKDGKPGKAQVASRRNALDACPDCGRGLVAPRDLDARVPLLICHRLHGLSLASLTFTPHDVIACGLA